MHKHLAADLTRLIHPLTDPRELRLEGVDVIVVRTLGIEDVDMALAFLDFAADWASQSRAQPGTCHSSRGTLGMDKHAVADGDDVCNAERITFRELHGRREHEAE